MYNLFNYKGYSFEITTRYCNLCCRETYLKYGELSDEYYEELREYAWKPVIRIIVPDEEESYRVKAQNIFICEDCLEQILMRFKRGNNEINRK